MGTVVELACTVDRFIADMYFVTCMEMAGDCVIMKCVARTIIMTHACKFNHSSHCLIPSLFLKMSLGIRLQFP